ncbi:MAG: hypothetical protein HFG76_10850 [Hungatella sp.]|jgi:hypothetical protein|nr:hypothetical protein [Hungatella sp.]MCI9636387.1 hypothetical protein [Hungatella sp.]
MKNLLVKLKMKAILPAAAIFAAAAIGTTFAWQTWDLSVTNELRSHVTEVEVEEPNFRPDKGVKQVQFKNTGNSSVFLRISFTEYWEKVESDGSSEYLLSNKVNGTEMARKHWTKYWESEWIDGKDGWYYYTKVLKSGKATELILDGVTFENVTNDNQEYLNANYRLYFKAEVVQCSDGGNTLNSSEVNKDATSRLFGKEATVIGETVEWK